MRRSGFTLLEVVIAAAATAALTVTALAALGTATGKWTNLQRAAMTRVMAETMLDRISAELQSTYQSSQSTIVAKAIAAGASDLQVIPQFNAGSSVPVAVELHLTLPGVDGPQSFRRRIWTPAELP